MQEVAKADGQGGERTGSRALLPPDLPLRASALRRRNGSARPAGTSPERGVPFPQDHEITSDKGWPPLGETAFREGIARLRRECGRTPSRRESGERLTPRRAVSAPFPLETVHSRLWRATVQVLFLSTSTVVVVNSAPGGRSPRIDRGNFSRANGFCRLARSRARLHLFRRLVSSAMTPNIGRHLRVGDCSILCWPATTHGRDAHRWSCRRCGSGRRSPRKIGNDEQKGSPSAVANDRTN